MICVGGLSSALTSHTLTRLCALPTPVARAQGVHIPYVATPAMRAHYAAKGVTSENEQDYYGVITQIDAAVGRVRALLHTYGASNNTLLLISADNGPEVRRRRGEEEKRRRRDEEKRRGGEEEKRRLCVCYCIAVYSCVLLWCCRQEFSKDHNHNNHVYTTSQSFPPTRYALLIVR